jgi:hypothetical protein
MSDEIAKVGSKRGIRFARAASRHRVSKDSVRHVIANHRVHFEEPPPPGTPPGGQSTRLVYLGDNTDERALEIMAVELPSGHLLVIHAMPLRAKYRKQYEEVVK